MEISVIRATFSLQASAVIFFQNLAGWSAAEVGASRCPLADESAHWRDDHRRGSHADEPRLIQRVHYTRLNHRRCRLQKTLAAHRKKKQDQQKFDLFLQGEDLNKVADEKNI